MDIDFSRTLKYKDFLSKYVKVKTVDRLSHEGWLKSIDPVSGSLILLTFNDEMSKIVDTVLIIGDAYTNVEVIKEADENMKKLIEDLHSSRAYVDNESIKKRKDRLLELIKKNRLPVRENTEDRSLLVCESVTIHPPYEADNCTSCNGRVLMKVRELLISVVEKEGL